MCNSDKNSKSLSPPGGARLSSGSTPIPESLDPVITLKVGEQTFHTKADTLEESGFLKALVSPLWASNKQVDGSYFIDADPSLFEHILRYLRRGVLPIFYDKVKGHDHALYLALLAESDFFQIQRLHTWLEQKGYLAAVKTRVSVADAGEDLPFTETINAHKELEIRTHVVTKNVYVCPRGKPGHMGTPSQCGKACNNAQPASGPQYIDEDCVKTVVVRKETIFDGECCLKELQTL